MNLRMTILLGSTAAVAALAELLDDNGYNPDTGEFDYGDVEAAPAPQPAPAAAPAGVPSPPSASAPASTAGKRETKKQKAAREAAEAAAAQPAAAPATPLVTQEQLDAPVSPALAALAGVPQPPAAAPAAPSAPAAPAAPAAVPAPPPAGLVDPAAYVAPAAYTLEVLQAAMANLLANGRSASQAQAFLLKNTGFKALKDLPSEWYPRAHWCLATGQDA